MKKESMLYCAHKGCPKPVRKEAQIKIELRGIIRRCSSIDYRRAIRKQLQNLMEEIS